jgi:hypothetical protein
MHAKIVPLSVMAEHSRFFKHGQLLFWAPVDVVARN